MTQTLKTLALSAIAGAAMAVSASASAITLTNSTGSYANWGGFDWAENGSAVVTGFDPTVVNDTFSLVYFADAVSVSQAGGGQIVGATIGLLSGNYEYTIVANLNETSTCNAFSGGICVDASFAVTSGSFNIYYDIANDASATGASNGTGFDDGALIISGILNPQASGGFNLITGGSSTLSALITYTNNAFINPDLYASIATTTLQIGGNVTNWTAPTGMPNGGGTAVAIPTGALLLQADGNQTFTARVPEPGVLGLLGAAMLGMALTRRRKSVN